MGSVVQVMMIDTPRRISQIHTLQFQQHVNNGCDPYMANFNLESVDVPFHSVCSKLMLYWRGDLDL